MCPDTRISRLMAIAALVLASLLAAASAFAADTETPEAAEKADSASDAAVLSPEEHWAKAEAEYDGKWLPIPKLFDQYRQTRNQLRLIELHGSDSQQQLEKLQREMAQLRGEARKEEQPIRRELGKARQELLKYNSLLRRRPPAKPELLRTPSPPRRPSSSYGNSSSNYGGSYGGRNGMSGWYEKARRDWQRQCDQIKRQNETRMQKYQNDLKEYNAAKSEAKAGIPKAEAKVKKCMAQLDELDAEYEDKGEPTKRQSDNATERVRAHNRRVEVIETRLKQQSEALQAVPEPVRFKHGIIYFEKEFHTDAELREILRRDQAQIDRVRTKLQADCEQAGLPFPEDWRHPQQERLDKIGVLLQAAKKAQAETG